MLPVKGYASCLIKPTVVNSADYSKTCHGLTCRPTRRLHTSAAIYNANREPETRKIMKECGLREQTSPWREDVENGCYVVSRVYILPNTSQCSTCFIYEAADAHACDVICAFWSAVTTVMVRFTLVFSNNWTIHIRQIYTNWTPRNIVTNSRENSSFAG